MFNFKINAQVCISFLPVVNVGNYVEFAIKKRKCRIRTGQETRFSKILKFTESFRIVSNNVN